MGLVRRAAVAGSFYPSQSDELGRTIGNLLMDCRQEVRLPLPPKALIVPHAGYVYSGAVAASAYALLRPLHAEISRVVLLGPVHRVPISGLALPGGEAFATPLGTVPLDLGICKQLEALPQVSVNPAAHALEHSLEVQLPFLQRVLDHFTLVPLAVGDTSAEQVAEVLEQAWGGSETLIVISSDLSHYLPYPLARRVDQDTALTILELSQQFRQPQPWGAKTITRLLRAAQQHQLEPHLLDIRNSGDTSGDKERVVGYASFAFCESPK